MDITSSIFWQHVVLIVLLIPYFGGIGFSTYYAQKQRRTEMTRHARQHIVKE